MVTRGAVTGTCSKEGCPSTFHTHEWGNKEAQRLGWFIQRNGDAWCPDHNPPWVAQWRAAQAQKKIDKKRDG